MSLLLFKNGLWYDRMLWQSSDKQFKHCPMNLLDVDDLVLGSENRANSSGSQSCPQML